jgi:ribosomal protein S18 acetylase RimI-like enzyme
MIPLTVHEINDLTDPLLLPWLDLYETSFPYHEKVMVSNHLAAIQRRAAGNDRNHVFLAALSAPATLVGIARYHMLPEVGVACLWYLAIAPQARSAGLGTRVYQEIVHRLEPSVFRALIFEVEIPANQPGETERENARRRIRFYHRQGARLLTGIEYLQYVGPHCPATPMHLMVQPLRPLAPQDAYRLAKVVYQEALEQRGKLAFD